MRAFCVGIAATICAGSVQAAPVVLTAGVGGTTKGFIDQSDPSQFGGCPGIRSGPFTASQSVGPVTVAYYGHEGIGMVNDVRANFEFQHGFTVPIYKASLQFKAEPNLTTAHQSCIMAYKGDGVINTDDYIPNDADVFFNFENFNTVDGGNVYYLADVDITQLLNEYISSGHEYLGLNFAISNFEDTDIFLSGVKIVVQAVPEPATLALFGLGFSGLAIRRRKS